MTQHWVVHIQKEINNIVHKVNYAWRKILLKWNVSIDVDGETTVKVNSIKYIGAINTNTCSCSENTKARIRSANQATMKQDAIWKDRGIRK